MVEEYLLLVEQKEENAFQFLTKAATKVNITLAGDVGTELLAGFMVIEMKKYTFTKEERLCSKRLIDDLFHNGSSFVVYPFRVVFLVKPDNPNQEFPVQVITSVPKKRFKRAVDRNYLKRLMRESYRLEKHQLYSILKDHSLNLLLAIQYVSNEKLSLETLQSKLQQLIGKLKNEISKSNLGEGN